MWYDVENMDRKDAVLIIIRHEHDGSGEWGTNCENMWNLSALENN